MSLLKCVCVCVCVRVCVHNHLTSKQAFEGGLVWPACVCVRAGAVLVGNQDILGILSGLV